MKVFAKITIRHTAPTYHTCMYLRFYLTSSLSHLVSNWIWLLQHVHIFLFQPLHWPSSLTLQNFNSRFEAILSLVPSKCPHVLWCGQQHEAFRGILQTKIADFISKITGTLTYITFINVDKNKTRDWPNNSDNDELATSTISRSNMAAEAKKLLSFH